MSYSTNSLSNSANSGCLSFASSPTTTVASDTSDSGSATNTSSNHVKQRNKLSHHRQQQPQRLTNNARNTNHSARNHGSPAVHWLIQLKEKHHQLSVKMKQQKRQLLSIGGQLDIGGANKKSPLQIEQLSVLQVIKRYK